MANALDPTNPDYAGVDPEYKAHAYDRSAPDGPEDGVDRVLDEVQAAENDASRNRVQPIATQGWLTESDQTTPQPWND